MLILDGSGPKPRVLMGKRHAGHKFMPGKYVFPGGRIEALPLHADCCAEQRHEAQARQIGAQCLDRRFHPQHHARGNAAPVQKIERGPRDGGIFRLQADKIGSRIRELLDCH